MVVYGVLQRSRIDKKSFFVHACRCCLLYSSPLLSLKSPRAHQTGIHIDSHTRIVQASERNVELSAGSMLECLAMHKLANPACLACSLANCAPFVHKHECNVSGAKLTFNLLESSRFPSQYCFFTHIYILFQNIHNILLT